MADHDSRAGPTYLTGAILAYADATHAPHDEALRRAFDAPERAGLAPIQLGACEAKLVAMLLRLAGARKVVELGTLAGYSALVMARALPADGHLWTVENDPRAARVARENIAAAGLSGRITVVEGAALEVLPTLER
ncbi:MAG TPA: class I SAM-dependent methyltransferase, partial [Polyangiaceae bacterium]|nr:class I SAM-dependent methyltransferase [Polyangiaceae bacterium]